MFTLRTGYFISGIATGLIFLFSFLITLPDGKLHIVFCDVGQGDAAYVRFPDGRDMVVDGGPNDRIVGCLGKHMPFWDRHIDMVLLTHPQKDHMQGLITVFERYAVDYFIRSDVSNATEGYVQLMAIVRAKRIPIKYITAGERIAVDATSLSFLWPSSEQIAVFKRGSLAALQGVPLSNASILGASSNIDLNDGSLVFWLRYGAFDALFTGDADTRVEQHYINTRLADDRVEVLKVPHHGSKTGINSEFVRWLRPQLAIISVGKNMYGHPSAEVLDLFESVSTRVLRTDTEGDIEVVSDGKTWALRH